MARVEPEHFTEKAIELVYIAGTVEEAQDVERALTEAEIDFMIGPEEFTQGVLPLVLGSVHTGAGFFVIRGQAGHIRTLLRTTAKFRGVVDASPE